MFIFTITESSDPPDLRGDTGRGAEVQRDQDEGAETGAEEGVGVLSGGGGVAVLVEMCQDIIGEVEVRLDIVSLRGVLRKREALVLEEGQEGTVLREEKGVEVAPNQTEAQVLTNSKKHFLNLSSEG